MSDQLMEKLKRFINGETAPDAQESRDPQQLEDMKYKAKVMYLTMKNIMEATAAYLCIAEAEDKKHGKRPE